MGQIVLATATRYDSINLRAKLAFKTIEEAKNHGYPIVVIDKSTPEVREALQATGALIHLQEGSEMGESRRKTILEAVKLAGPEGIIVWLEPEKHTFVPLVAEVCRPFQDNPELDLVIPRRRSLESYPLMQQLAEELGREGFRLATGRALDTWFGPQAFRTRVADFYLNYKGPPDLWDSIHIPAAQIVKSGRKVAEVVVDYRHPPEQREEATLAFYQHRINQLSALCNALTKNL